MSIVVKGMGMPENCITCPMQFGGWCYVAPPEIDERVAPTVDEAVEQGKPQWCPLEELPKKHGQLIDKEDYRTQMSGCYGEYWEEVLDQIGYVIEAEDE